MFGGVIIGAGSHQTRLFWEGDEVLTDRTWRGDDCSAMLSCYTCMLMQMEGFTIDAGDVQQIAMRSVEHPVLVGGYGIGHDAYYRDIHFTNTHEYGSSRPADGHLCAGAAMGSERLYVNCRFTNHTYGVVPNGANSVNHNFYGCYFANCTTGVWSTTGGQCMFDACRFHNNSYFDVNISKTP